jgi:hypothetical protein
MVNLVGMIHATQANLMVKHTARAMGKNMAETMAPTIAPVNLVRRPMVRTTAKITVKSMAVASNRITNAKMIGISTLDKGLDRAIARIPVKILGKVLGKVAYKAITNPPDKTELAVQTL